MWLLDQDWASIRLLTRFLVKFTPEEMSACTVVIQKKIPSWSVDFSFVFAAQPKNTSHSTWQSKPRTWQRCVWGLIYTHGRLSLLCMFGGVALPNLSGGFLVFVLHLLLLHCCPRSCVVSSARQRGRWGSNFILFPFVLSLMLFCVCVCHRGNKVSIHTFAQSLFVSLYLSKELTPKKPRNMATRICVLQIFSRENRPIILTQHNSVQQEVLFFWFCFYKVKIPPCCDKSATIDRRIYMQLLLHLRRAFFIFCDFCRARGSSQVIECIEIQWPD